jgi:hypothetical protein
MNWSATSVARQSPQRRRHVRVADAADLLDADDVLHHLGVEAFLEDVVRDRALPAGDDDLLHLGDVGRRGLRLFLRQRRPMREAPRGGRRQAQQPAPHRGAQ